MRLLTASKEAWRKLSEYNAAMFGMLRHEGALSPLNWLFYARDLRVLFETSVRCC